jgi:alpha-ribazole phosphatase
MAIQCPRCRRQYDVTLFQFDHPVLCECGATIDLQRGHVSPVTVVEEPTPGLEFAPQPVRPELPVTELILVRHGETDANVAFVIQGHTDTPLNDRGRQQALDLAERFLDERLAAVYSSDLARCVETAEIIAREKGLSVVATPALREAQFGQWEGKTAEELRLAFPDEYLARQADAYNFHPPDGESKREVLDRVLAFLRDLAQRHQGTKVLVVTHGGPITVVLHHVLGIAVTTRAPFRVDNASIHRIEASPAGWLVLLLNDTCHLREEEGPGVHLL